MTRGLSLNIGDSGGIDPVSRPTTPGGIGSPAPAVGPQIRLAWHDHIETLLQDHHQRFINHLDKRMQAVEEMLRSPRKHEDSGRVSGRSPRLGHNGTSQPLSPGGLKPQSLLTPGSDRALLLPPVDTFTVESSSRKGSNQATDRLGLEPVLSAGEDIIAEVVGRQYPSTRSKDVDVITKDDPGTKGEVQNAGENSWTLDIDSMLSSQDGAQSNVLSGILVEDAETVVVKSVPVMDFTVREEWDALNFPQSPFKGKGLSATASSAIVRESTQPRLMLRNSAGRRGMQHMATSSSHWSNHLGVFPFLEWFLAATVIPPGSALQICWDVMACCVVMHDIFEVPLQAFNPDNTTPYAVFTKLFSQLFWNADILVSFRTGFFNNDDPVVDYKEVARNYIKTWFTFDITIVSIDWLLFALEERAKQDDEALGPFIAKAGKTFKVFRAVRTIKMLRLMKMRRAFGIVEESLVHSMAGCTTPVMGIAKFLFAILLVCHFLCCGWYWVGSSAGAEGWVQRLAVDDLPFWDRYLMTFHWSLAQFGVGTTQSVPVTTVPEYIVNIIILLCGLLVTALLVSSVTNTFSVMQQQTAEHYHQMWLLRRFCVENDFPRALTRRITKHIERQGAERGGKTEIVDVRLLSMLSRPLYAEVMFYVHLPPLSTHAFLRLLCRDDSYTLRQVAVAAVTELLLAENDLIFIRGSIAKTAFNVLDGVFSYERDFAEMEMEEVVRPAWISEQVLWTNWVHQGDLGSRTTCRCLALDAKAFCEEVRSQSDTLQMVQQYAARRVEAMKRMNPEDLTDIVLLERHTGNLRMYSGDLVIPELNARTDDERQPGICSRVCAFICRCFCCCCRRRKQSDCNKEGLETIAEDEE